MRLISATARDQPLLPPLAPKQPSFQKLSTCGFNGQHFSKLCLSVNSSQHYSFTTTMLSRTLGGYGRNGVVAKRTVTTDAASAHADKDAVPEVCFFLPHDQLSQLDEVELP
jgi:hypothetical protein